MKHYIYLQHFETLYIAATLSNTISVCIIYYHSSAPHTILVTYAPNHGYTTQHKSREHNTTQSSRILHRRTQCWMAVNCANCQLLTAILCPIVVISCWVGLSSLFTGQVDSADIYIFLSVPSPLDLLSFYCGIRWGDGSKCEENGNGTNINIILNILTQCFPTCYKIQWKTLKPLKHIA